MVTQEINWKNLPGPESISRSVLQNGITVLSFNNPHVKSIYMVGLLNCGCASDPLEKLGLAHFTANMLSRGTTNRKFNEFHQELENRGANLSFGCGSNHTWFRGKALAEDLEILFDLSTDGLRRASFSQEYFNRVQSQLLAGLAIREQNTSEIASQMFDSYLYPNHPYGRPRDGFIHTIQAIERQDLVHFHNDYFSPQDMILVVAGAVSGDTVSALAKKYFADWNNPDAKKFDMPAIPQPPKKNIRQHRHIEEKSQVDLIMGTMGPTRTSNDYLPAFLGNNILGRFGLMGRIGASVRSRSGLAYHASSNITAWQDGGTWEITAGTNAENLDKTIELIQAEVKRFVESPVTQEELEDSKSNLVGRLPLSLESNAGIANAILSMERFHMGLDYYQRYAEIIKSISAEDILTVSRKYLSPDKLVIASAGPGDDIL